MTSSPAPLESGDGIDDDGLWQGPALLLGAAADEAIGEALQADRSAYGRLQALAGLDRACRRIAAAVKAQRVAEVRGMVEEHGVTFTACCLGVDPTTIRRLAPQHARFQRAAHPKARERQAVNLYLEGHSVDAVATRLRLGHRRVKRVLLAAGVELRETHDPRTVKERDDVD